MSLHTPLPTIPDPDNQRRYNLMNAVIDALSPYCDDPFVCRGLYPRIIYNTYPSHFCGYLRDMYLHFPPDVISAMINGVLYIIEIPAISQQAAIDKSPSKLVANDLNSFQNWFSETIKKREGNDEQP